MNHLYRKHLQSYSNVRPSVTVHPTVSSEYWEMNCKANEILWWRNCGTLVWKWWFHRVATSCLSTGLVWVRFSTSSIWNHLLPLKLLLFYPMYECRPISRSMLTESKSDLSTETDESKDFRFTKWLTKTVGVMGIPPTVFYNEQHKAPMETFIRFCFFKKQENLDTAIELLEKWTSTSNVARIYRKA